MAYESGVSGHGGDSHNLFNRVNHDNNTSERNNYTTRPPTFSGDSSEFE